MWVLLEFFHKNNIRKQPKN